MSTETNEASWIMQPQTAVVLDVAPKPTPGPGEILVKINCIAFTPIEYKIQKFGTHPIPYPAILGTSFAGTVVSVGDSTSSFAPGDHVAVNRIGRMLGDPRFGGFQKFALATVSATSKLDPSTPLQAGAAVIINVAAVVSALSIHLGLARPPLDGSAPPPQNKTVLVYGGSSSCGGLAVRYLATAGYRVVTTSSPHNRDFVAGLGPEHVIDHTKPAHEIVAAIAAYGPYDAVFDSIGLPPVTDMIVEYLASVGGGSYNTLIPPLGGEKPIPDNVHRKFAPYSWAFEEEANKEIAQWLYNEYVPLGLKTGLIVPTRQEVLHGGLAKVQDALDLMAKGGISGKKLVMDPWVE